MTSPPQSIRLATVGMSAVLCWSTREADRRANRSASSALCLCTGAPPEQMERLQKAVRWIADGRQSGGTASRRRLGSARTVPRHRATADQTRADPPTPPPVVAL